MEAAAAARKQRLLALRQLRADEETGQPGLRQTAAGRRRRLAIIKRSFRNYDPSTGQARTRQAAPQINDTVENAVRGLQEAVIAEDDLKRQEELDLLNIAPKKPNWDLKRDMEKRLSKLERRDQEARMILIRQRIAGSRNSGQAGAGDANELSQIGAEVAATAATDKSLRRLVGYDMKEEDDDEDESDLSGED
ncbi:hypothetical protein OC861_003319 [Tilletia horrida]|nr:hypothetical protein OC861_003319 [Tilletia horrida]